jgi:TRAP-type C4-dicarboxylate transport system substrate-binding protein
VRPARLGIPEDRYERASNLAHRWRTMRGGPTEVRRVAIDMIRLVQVLILVLIVIVSTACGTQTANKAGGPAAPVVLRMATVNGEAGFNPAVDELLRRVEALSNGNVKIEMVFHVGEFEPDSEQQIVRGVADGTYDLGVAGTRVFDTLGVSDFQALDAPMLIDNYTVEAAVIEGDMPARMLRSLDQLHVSGLGVLADGLRKPIAVEKPLLGPNNWRGIPFGVYRSLALSSAVRALGAEPIEVFGSRRDQFLEQDQIAGFEMNLLGFQILNMSQRAPYIAANVNLWPQVLAIVGNPKRLDSLSGEQRDSLTRALREAAAASTGLVKGDDGFIADLCRQGARFATASDADILGLRDAFAPVYRDLRRNPITAQFISEIEQFKPRTSTTAVAIPDGCTGPAPDLAAQPSVQPNKTTTVTPLDGTWEVTFTEEEFAATEGVDPSEIGPGAAGTSVVTFDRGDITVHVKAGEQAPDGLTYAVEGDTFTIYATDASMGGQIPPPGPAVWKYRWSVFNDTLTFKKLGGQEPNCSLTVSKGMCEPSVFVVKPWHRIN